MEIYKKVIGYDGFYQISNLGNVKSLRKNIILKPCLVRGYYCVNLWKPNKRKTTPIHKLVAIAFLNHIPNKFKIVVDHIDNNKLNNNVENLRLVSNRTNSNKKHLNTTSKYIGVSFQVDRNKWIANIQIEGKNIYLGRFIDEYDAHLAYQSALNNHLKKNTKKSKYEI